MMSSFIRVRLSFALVSVDEPMGRWFLIDTSVCRVVADLEYMIKERFDLRKILKRGGAIDLFLDEYLLPSQEKIEVIRDNDVIRVQESTWQLGNAEHSPTAATKEKPRATKRKGNNAEVQFSKRQHFQVNAGEDEEENERTQGKQSTTSKEKSKEKKKPKSKNLPLENGVITGSETVGKKDEKQKDAKQIKQAGHSNKHKNESDANPVAFPKSRANKGKVVSEHSISSSSAAAAVASKPVAGQSDETSAKNVRHSVPQVVHRHTNSERIVLSASGSTHSAEVANGTSLVASRPLGDLQTDLKNVCDARSLGSRNNNAEKSSFPRINIGQRQPQLPIRMSNAGTQSRGSPKSSFHIRFDSDGEDEEPRGSEVKGQGSLVNGTALVVTSPPRDTGRTVPHNATPTTSFDSQLQGVEQISFTRHQSSVANGAAGGSLSYGLERGCIEQPECTKPQPSGKVSRDYSQSVALHGPPRVGDRIAYKILELSASYTPEISDYKEGTVLGYDSKSDTVHLELTIESLDIPLGDGNVSKKFELIYEEEGEESEEKQDIPVSEEDRQVAVRWCSMRDPLLLSAGAGSAN